MCKTETRRVVRGGTSRDNTRYSRTEDWWSNPIRSVSKVIGIRLVEEVEGPKTTLSASGSYPAGRGSSWNGGPQYAQAVGRIRVNPDVYYYAVAARLIEVIDE